VNAHAPLALARAPSTRERALRCVSARRGVSLCLDARRRRRRARARRFVRLAECFLLAKENQQIEFQARPRPGNLNLCAMRASWTAKTASLARRFQRIFHDVIFVFVNVGDPLHGVSAGVAPALVATPRAVVS